MALARLSEEKPCCSCGREKGNANIHSSYGPGPQDHRHCDLCYTTILGSRCRGGLTSDLLALAQVGWFVIDETVAAPNADYGRE